MNCCICGTVRNCGKYLDKIFSNMESVGKLFNDYRIILYYDQSTDNTFKKIKEYSKKNDKVLFFINRSPLLKYRTHRIALGRNFCIKKIKEQFSDYPFFIMMDCDDRCARNMNLNILNKYLYNDSWDALSFQHPCGYYDTWALSILPHVLSCHHSVNQSGGAKKINRIISNAPPNHLITCLSAFNGFSIYRTEKFLNCHYDGRFRLDYFPKWMLKIHFMFNGGIIVNRKSRFTEDCEHRHFHIQSILQNNSRIRICPKSLFF